LVGVHPDLVRVVHRAAYISTLDFTVLEGLRTQKRQAELVKAGASRTLNSRHLTGHAVDLGVLVAGVVRWDWPLYNQLAAIMKQAAQDERVPLIWGGDWRTFKDGPHYELPRKDYP
jgi:peptidoglycan L-alanyl-D-glutamate endopeptidase CwlK